MKKVRIGVTAIALLVGLIGAFASNGKIIGAVYWTMVSTHVRSRLFTVSGRCAGGVIKCAVQYTTVYNMPTGIIKFKSL